MFVLIFLEKSIQGECAVAAAVWISLCVSFGFFTSGALVFDVAL